MKKIYPHLLAAPIYTKTRRRRGAWNTARRMVPKGYIAHLVACAQRSTGHVAGLLCVSAGQFPRELIQVSFLRDPSRRPRGGFCAGRNATKGTHTRVSKDAQRARESESAMNLKRNSAYVGHRE